MTCLFSEIVAERSEFGDVLGSVSGSNRLVVNPFSPQMEFSASTASTTRPSPAFGFVKDPFSAVMYSAAFYMITTEKPLNCCGG